MELDDFEHRPADDEPEKLSRMQRILNIFSSIVIPPNQIQQFIDFRNTPTVELFNKIVADEHLVDDLAVDRDLMYVQLEGETEDNRIHRMRKTREKTEPCKIYTNNILLVWIHMIIKQYPHVVIECTNPLLLERTQTFAKLYLNDIIKYARKLCSRPINLHNYRIPRFIERYIIMHAVMYIASNDQTYLTDVVKNLRTLLKNDESPASRRFVTDVLSKCSIGDPDTPFNDEIKAIIEYITLAIGLKGVA